MSNDDVATIEKPLTAEEVRKTMLHLAAAIHNLQGSVEQSMRAIGLSIPNQSALNVSRLQLAEALKILVKDPSDG